MGSIEGAIQDTGHQGRARDAHRASVDAMVREQQWICPIYSKEGNSAYHARGEDNHIVVPLKGQFKDGENFYSTLLHEMAHSTGEPEHLNREKA